jgi:hypothetical protein
MTPVFLSCGAPHTEAQEQFLAAVESLLRSHDCLPQTVGRSSYSVRQPVEAARELIAECNGAVVIAFERTRLLSGFDKPGGAAQKDLRDESYPTIWNQMEAAMAYARRVPILTFVQKGVKRQGMLSDRLEWMAIETDLTPDLLGTERFRQAFAEWRQLVRKRSALTPAPPAAIAPAEMTVGQIVSALKPGQLWAALAVAATLLAFTATAAFQAGQAWNGMTQTAPPRK